jgi:DNA primase
MADLNEIYEILLKNRYQERLFDDLDKFSRHGDNYQACCPFHEDRTPSLSISGDKPLWYCHAGCGGGDWIDYLQRKNGFEFKEALQNLANEAGIKLDDNKSYTKSEKSNMIFEDAQEYFVKSLFSSKGEEGYEYLINRGYSEREIRAIEIGYYPGYDMTVKHLDSMGYSQHDIMTAFKWLKIGNNLYREDYKITIPYKDEIGRVKGFFGRLIRSLREGEKEVDKYKPLTDAEGIKTTPFNIHRAKDYSSVVIVEGYFDALTLLAKGIENTIAVAGTSIKKEHLQMMKRYKIRKLYLCLDNDESGRKAISKFLKETDPFFRYFVVELDDNSKDPDEYIKKNGLEKFVKRIDLSPIHFKWIAKNIVADNKLETDAQRDQAIEELIMLDAKISDPIDSLELKKFIEEKLNIPLNVLELKTKDIRQKLSKEREIELYKQLNRMLARQIDSNDHEEIKRTIAESMDKLSQIRITETIEPYSVEQLRSDLSLKREGMATGWHSLDQYVSIPSGAITFIAGRPSHGKTSFLLNMLLNQVEKFREKSFFVFSYEEDKAALSVKLINMMGRTIISDKLMHKNTEQVEYYIRGNNKLFEKVNEAVEQYDRYVKQKRLWIVDKPLDVNALCDVIKNLSNSYDIGGVYVDYVQRVKYEGKYQDERIKIARIAEVFRESAVETNIPYIIGAQLNRESKGRPKLDYLKEAGNLEEDANLVLGLYNLKTAAYKETDKEVEMKNINGKTANISDRNVDMEVHILKNRNGRINESTVLTFDPPVLYIKDNNEMDTF